MSKGDDDGIGLAVTWSGQGISAKIKSRLISALDMLGSRRVEERGLDAERRVLIHKAITEGQALIIKAASEARASEIANDPEQSRRALQVFERATRKQDNVEACIDLAIEDLQNRDAAIGDDIGSDDLDSHIVSRWEHYASHATTDELRERWGRVLAAEARKPGTFSAKCLRIVDELDPEVAKQFSRLCSRRIDSWVAECICPVGTRAVEALQEAGLLFMSERGREAVFHHHTLGDGAGCSSLEMGRFRIDVKAGGKLPDALISLIHRGAEIGLPVYQLSEAGLALASILPLPNQDTPLMISQVLLIASGNPERVSVHKYENGEWSELSPKSVYRAMEGFVA